MTRHHVFVTRGDMLNIACDAWMLPTDRRKKLNEVWLDRLPELDQAVRNTSSPEFSEGSRYAMPVSDWPTDIPLPVLTAVPLTGFDEASELGPRVQSFIEEAASAVHTSRRTMKRPVPLLAMPLLGTGHGGGHLIRGDVLQSILFHARKTAEQEGLDVVLVLHSEEDFALAQELRKRSSTGWWSSLDPTLLNECRELAGDARGGRLVPFMGSGVSVSAGGPTWTELIRGIADQINLPEDEVRDLERRNVLDQAHVLKVLYEEGKADRTSFAKAVADRLDLKRYGLAPSLLAALPSHQAITLNYDELFEKASKDAGRSVTVIPGREHSTPDGGWLLKLHGSVTEPESIVLTREDYLGYNTSRDALAALVKATLITHRLLFVGFGLTDDHFHEIVHDVRGAMPADSRDEPELATALTLFDDSLDQRAWQDKLRLLPMSAKGTTTEEAARTLEIFLDALLAYATDTHSYLLAEGYDKALDDGERSLRKKLLQLRAGLSDEELGSSGGQHLSKMLTRLGYNE